MTRPGHKIRLGLFLGLSSAALLMAACEPVATPPAADTATGEKAAAATETTTLPMPIPINAVMVSLVDFAADGIWRPPVQDRAMTDKEWKLAEKDAVDLIAAATLITTPGTGVNDADWVREADWQRWSREMQQVAVGAKDAVVRKDQGALKTAGDELVEICEACHKKYKPGLPTMGITRFPVYPKYPEEPAQP